MAAGQIPEEFSRQNDLAATIFGEHWDLLYSVVFSMLGDQAEVEGVLRESFVRWAATADLGIRHATPALVRFTVATAIARLRRLPRLGPWLPEPLLGDLDLSLAESVSAAMKEVLERLPPEEQTVLVLHEGFGLSYADVAQAMGRSEDYVRLISQNAEFPERAGDALHAGYTGVLERFMKSCMDNDGKALQEVLAPDVVLVSDRANGRDGTMRVQGPGKVADFLLTFIADECLDPRFQGIHAEDLAVLWTAEGSSLGAVIVRLSETLVAGIDLLGHSPRVR